MPAALSWRKRMVPLETSKSIVSPPESGTARLVCARSSLKGVSGAEEDHTPQLTPPLLASAGGSGRVLIRRIVDHVSPAYTTRVRETRVKQLVARERVFCYSRFFKATGEDLKERMNKARYLCWLAASAPSAGHNQEGPGGIAPRFFAVPMK